jgi:hypothetical protein
MKRSVAMSIVLTVITCGLYSLYWFIVLTDEVNKAANTPSDTSGVMSFLLTIITCGIYGLYWSYKMGDKLDRATGQNASRGILYLVLNLLGVGIVTYALIQDSLNKM